MLKENLGICPYEENYYEEEIIKFNIEESNKELNKESNKELNK